MTMRRLMVFLIALVIAYGAYWYVYGRERDLFEGTDLEGLGKAIGRYIKASDADESEGKRLSDLSAQRRADLGATLDGRLALRPSSSGGSTLEGSLVSSKPDWITNRAYVHIRILQKKHCGEELHNFFVETDWDKKCAADPTHSVTDVVHAIFSVADLAAQHRQASTVIPGCCRVVAAANSRALAGGPDL